MKVLFWIVLVVAVASAVMAVVNYKSTQKLKAAAEPISTEE